MVAQAHDACNLDEAFENVLKLAGVKSDLFRVVQNRKLLFRSYDAARKHTKKPNQRYGTRKGRTRKTRNSVASIDWTGMDFAACYWSLCKHVNKGFPFSYAYTYPYGAATLITHKHGLRSVPAKIVVIRTVRLNAPYNATKCSVHRS